MTGLGSLPDERLPLLGRPAQGARAWGPSRCAPTPCSAERALLQPIGDDRARKVVDAAVFDREAEVRIVDPRFAGRPPLDNDQPAVDLLPPVHPRRIFLTDEAALVEADAVQFGSIAFEPKKVAELDAALADTKAKAMLKPAVGGLSGGAQPSVAELGEPWIGLPSPVSRPVHAISVIALDADRAPQPVERQALDRDRRRPRLRSRAADHRHPPRR